MDAFYILTGRKLLVRKGEKTMKVQSALWVEVGAEGGLGAGKSCRKRLHPERNSHIDNLVSDHSGVQRSHSSVLSATNLEISP